MPASARNSKPARIAHSTRPLVLAASFSTALVCGCNVGPKYVKPNVPAPPAYKESAPDAYNSAPGGTWKPAQPQDAMLKGKWWEAFNEPELNDLEEQLDINNQNIAQYFQNFMEARTLVRQARSQYFPTVSVDPSYSREKSSSALRGLTYTNGTTTTTGAGGTGTTGTGTGGTGTTGTGTGTTTGASSTSGGTFTDMALPFDVSWEPDLWGRVRNEVHEYQYAAQVSAADLENERLTEQADLAEYYFELRGQDALQDLYDKTVGVDRQTLDLTNALVQTGIDSPQSAAEAEMTLHQAEEDAAGIASNRALYEHAIATLIGKPASSFSLPVKGLTTPVPSIPVGVPSQLLQRRPDVAAAERTMAEANALIGVEKAAYYPALSLTGSGGLEASSISSLFSVPALFWSLGASAPETIFDAGLRRATVAQYTAEYNADVASYKQTVLTAFQQVEDYLATLRVTSLQTVRQQQAINAAQVSLDLENSRYQTGIDPYLDVLTAQSTLLSQQQTQVTLRVSEMTAAVELVQALGGGWDTTQLPAASTITSNAAAQQVSHTP